MRRVSSHNHRPRYTVFGVAPDRDNLMIEIDTESARKVAVLLHMHSAAGYSARVWDRRYKRFVPQNVIDRFVNHLNRGANHGKNG